MSMIERALRLTIFNLARDLAHDSQTKGITIAEKDIHSKRKMGLVN